MPNPKTLQNLSAVKAIFDQEEADKFFEEGKKAFPELDPEGNRPDLPAHALASQVLAEEVGKIPAVGAGIVRELGSGLANRFLRGGEFFSKQGFDVDDVLANIEGIMSSGSETGSSGPSSAVTSRSDFAGIDTIPNFQDGGVVQDKAPVVPPSELSMESLAREAKAMAELDEIIRVLVEEAKQ